MSRGNLVIYALCGIVSLFLANFCVSILVVMRPNGIMGDDFFEINVATHYKRFQSTLRNFRVKAATRLSPSPKACRTHTGCHVPCLSEFYDKPNMDHALRMLEVGSMPDAKPAKPLEQGSVFEAVEIAIPLAPPFIDHDPKEGNGQGEKNIILMSSDAGNDRCLVYGVGINGDSSFESRMVKEGHSTFAFDCTVSMDARSVSGKMFTFYQWCIGDSQEATFASNNRYHSGNASALKLLSLAGVLEALGHSHIDVLKFDIEGFEWELIHEQLFRSSLRPWQLAFELHTEGASSAYVPQSLVKGKSYVAVNRLFLQLYNLGYRVVSKELNGNFCAEFVLVLVNSTGATYTKSLSRQR